MKKAATLLTLLLMSTAALFAQEKYGATEAEQQICKESLQIYKTFMDQKMDDNLVYKAWQTAHQECPCTASERLFSNGAKIIKKQIIASKEDKERLTVMIDSLMMIYDERIACYPSNKKYKDGMNAHYVAALKAGDMKKLLPKQKEEAFKLMETSVKALGNLATATLISNYYVDLYDHFKDAPDEEKDMWRGRLILEYLDLSDACAYNIANQSKDKKIEGYETAQGNLDEIFVVIANCEEMVPVLEKMVADAPDDLSTKEKALNLMNLKDCTETDFYLNTAESVCAVKPSPVCQFSIGIAYLKKNDLKSAGEYLDQAAESIESSDSNFMKYQLRAGQVAANRGQSGKAMKYANKMLDQDPNSGEAYLLRGDATAAQADACDDGRLGRYCAYWVAADIYARAKSIDPSVADKANKKINSVSKGFPTIDKVFEVGEQEGNTFTCPCTGGSTKIRIRK